MITKSQHGEKPESVSDVGKLVVGQTYMVFYKVPGVHRKEQAFVGLYLGTSAMHPGQLDFSLRPVMGTHTLEARHVLRFLPSTQKCGLRGQ